MTRVAHLLTHPVTLLEPQQGETDAYGQPSVTVTSHDALCHYRRVTTDDSYSNGALVAEDIELFLDPTVPVDSSWGVELNGATYTIVGEVTAAWNARTASEEYRSVLCRRAST